VLAAQLGAWLYPYIPSFDVHSPGGALHAPFDAMVFFKQTVFWLAVATLLEVVIGADRAKRALPAMAAFVILARLAIPGSAETGSEVAGAVAGAVGWWLMVSRIPARVAIVTGLFTAFVIVDALRPFTFLASPRHFEWTPFVSFIDGPRGHSSQVFLEKTFLYGALLWLLTRTGLGWLPSTVLAAAVVMTLRIIQIWLPGRSAEVTDVLMVLILAGVLKVLPD
jgi:hypothetical protein